MNLNRLRSTVSFGLLASTLFLANTASATDPPCEPFTVLDSNVADGETSVPRDTRLLVAYRGCGSKADVTLLRDGVAVESEITHGATVLPDEWTSVKPRSPLDANTSYVLKLTFGLASSTIAFTTGDELAASNTARPTVRIASSAFTSPVDASGFATATFEVELSPATPTQGGALFLDKTTASSEERARGAFDFAAASLAFDRGEPTHRITVNVGAKQGEPVCFSGTYEDEAGRSSDPSESTCAAVAGTPPAGPSPAAASAAPSSNGGCSTPRRGGSSGSLLAASGILVAAAAWRRRRR